MAATLTLTDVLRIVEIRTKIVSVSSVLIGTAYAVYSTHHLSLLLFLLLFVAAECVDIGTAGFNSYFDFIGGVDTVDSDVDRYKVLVHRAIEPRVAFWISCGAFGLGALFGLALGVRVGWEVIGVGAFGMAVSFFYSGGPLPLARTPCGEVLAGGLLGMVLIVLSTYVQTHEITSAALLLGLPSTTLIADILTVNNTCDIQGDAAAGRRTLSIVLGRSRSQGVIYGLGGLTYALAYLLLALRVLPIVAVVPLTAAAVFSAREFRRMHRRGYTHATKGPSMGSISVIFIAYSLAVLCGLGLGTVGR